MVCNRFIFAGTGCADSPRFSSWGPLIALAILPSRLWLLHFAVSDDLSFTAASVRFRVPLSHSSVIGFLFFHGLVWSAFLVIPGVMLAMRRRMREEGVAAVQRFAEDFMPLILLFAVSLTGLMLTVSYTWMKGYAYTFIAILHAITVIGTFLWCRSESFQSFSGRRNGGGFYKDVGAHQKKPTVVAAPRLARVCKSGSDRVSGSAFMYETGKTDDHYNGSARVAACVAGEPGALCEAIEEGRRARRAPMPMPLPVIGLGRSARCRDAANSTGACLAANADREGDVMTPLRRHLTTPSPIAETIRELGLTSPIGAKARMDTGVEPEKYVKTTLLLRSAAACSSRSKDNLVLA